jgi:hypothetical protein
MEVHIVGGGACYHEDYEVLAVFLDKSKAEKYLEKYAHDNGLEISSNIDDYYVKGFAYACIGTHKVMDADDVDTEIHELRLALMREWCLNHAECCTNMVPPWPHEGHCYYPLPDIIAALPQDVVAALLGELFARR